MYLGAGTGLRVGLGGVLLEDAVTFLSPQQLGGSSHAPESVAMISALHFKINCQSVWLEIFILNTVLVLFDFRFLSCGRAVQVGLSVAEDRECC